MIQRSLFAALKLGLDAIARDPAILDDIFGDNGFGLTPKEIEGIQTFFAEQPPTVVHGYARRDHTYPLIAITLGNESEVERFLGNSAGQVEDEDDPDFGAECLVTIWQHAYNIFIYSEHPDVTQYVYEVAKSIILTSDAAFQRLGFTQTSVTGMDLAPDPRYIPENLFVRQLAFTCQREFLRVDRATKLGKAFALRGLHIERDGSLSDPGDVHDNITIYTPGSED